MKKRIISICIMLPFLLFIVFGGVPLLVFNFVLACAAEFEFIRAALNTPKEKQTKPFILLCFIYAIFVPCSLMTFYCVNAEGSLIDGLKYFDWLILAIAFGTDIFAYIVGCSIGKHKLCPTVSPHKTVEGAIGGSIGCMVMTLVFGLTLGKAVSPLHYVIMGLVGAVLAQAGDLTASWFKRHFGIKDYSNLIPGHGGILDRFDSVTFVSAFVYVYMKLFLM